MARPGEGREQATEDDVVAAEPPVPDFDVAPVPHYEELASATTRGLAWTAGARVLQQALQFAITVVLARLLTPSDFGLIGLIAVFTGFATVLTDFGMAAALIQHRRITQDHLSSAFWLNLAAGACLSLLFVVLAPAIAWFYREPTLVALTAVSGAVFFINSTAAVQSAVVERGMDFRRLALIENAATLFGGVAAVSAAIAGASVWSLVVLSLAAAAARSVLLWIAGSWVPATRISRSAIRDLWGFSANLAAFNSVNYWARNADNLLVGKALGAQPLGIYTRAYSTMLLPMSQVGSVATRVMFPALSRIQDDTVRVRRVYLRSTSLIALVTFPIGVGLLVCAEPLVLSLYGEKWRSVIPILRLLAITGIIQSVTTTVGVIYQSQGRTDWMFRWAVGSTIVTIAGFAIGVQWGLVGVAVSYVIVNVIVFYFIYAIPGRLIQMRVRHVVHSVRHPLLASVIMGLVLFGVSYGTGGLMPTTELILDVVIGSAVYVVAVLIVARDEFRDLLAFVRTLRPTRA